MTLEEPHTPILNSLRFNLDQQADRISKLEKMINTRNTPLWKRILFRVDGWPTWTVVANEPAWRPWRRWWTS